MIEGKSMLRALLILSMSLKDESKNIQNKAILFVCSETIKVNFFFYCLEARIFVVYNHWPHRAPEFPFASCL